MRKRLLLLLFVVFTMPAVSQNVVRYGDSCYLFNPISPSDCVVGLYPTSIHASNTALGSMIGYEYVMHGEKIYGIAATLKWEKNTDVTVYLYRANGNYLEFVDSTSCYPGKTQFVYSAMYNNVLYEDTVPCYEFFFSQPHSIDDTIYIGATWNYDQSTTLMYCASDTTRSQHWTMLDTGTPIQYQIGASFHWGGYFPIIQPEQVACTAPLADVNVLGGGRAELTWDMEGDSCQLSITPYGMPIDSGLVVDLTDNSYIATGLAGGGAYYVARLRTQCHHQCCAHADSLVWSDWGAPKVFRIGNQGINGAEPVDWSLTPNPAHGSATVRCDEGIRSVELLTLKGEILMQRDVAGEQTCTLDLTGLAKGIYIVQITTPQGTAARKLAVE